MNIEITINTLGFINTLSAIAYILIAFAIGQYILEDRIDSRKKY